MGVRIRMLRDCRVPHGHVGWCEWMLGPEDGDDGCDGCGNEWTAERIVQCPDCGEVYRLVHPGADGRPTPGEGIQS